MERITNVKSPDGRLVLSFQKRCTVEWRSPASEAPTEPSTDFSPIEDEDDAAADPGRGSLQNPEDLANPVPEASATQVQMAFAFSCFYVTNMSDYRCGIIRLIEPGRFSEGSFLGSLKSQNFWQKILGISAAEQDHSFHLEATEDSIRGTLSFSLLFFAKMPAEW